MRLFSLLATAALLSTPATLARARVRVSCLPQVEYDTERGAGPATAGAYTTDQLKYDALVSRSQERSYDFPPYVDYEEIPISRIADRFILANASAFTAVRQATGSAAETRCVEGARSRMCVEFSALLAASTEEEEKYPRVKTVVMEAARLWADVFPSAVEIRMLAAWTEMGSGVLGSAGPTFLFWGGDCDLGLKPQLYTPPILNSILGRDFDDGFGILEHHFELSVSSAIDWHFGLEGETVPTNQLDFLSLVLHEMAHGLFFFSFSDVRSFQGSFRPGFGSNEFLEDGTQLAVSQRTPSHFDRFLTDDSKTPLVLLCEDGATFYNALVTAIRFFDPRATAAGRLTDFSMHSPPTYAYGTSTMHFLENADARAADCERNNLDGADPNQCSGLMSPSLDRGQAQHEIGENTKRILDSHLDREGGFSGTCKFNPWDRLF